MPVKRSSKQGSIPNHDSVNSRKWRKIKIKQNKGSPGFRWLTGTIVICLLSGLEIASCEWIVSFHDVTHMNTEDYVSAPFKSSQDHIPEPLKRGKGIFQAKGHYTELV